MACPADLQYSKEHEWIRVNGTEATIGITDHAQRELGDIVYVELPQPGAAVVQMRVFGVVESVKAISDLYSPASGTILRVNEKLVKTPELVNQDPYGTGWMIVVRFADAGELAGLMTADQYQAYIDQIRK